MRRQYIFFVWLILVSFGALSQSTNITKSAADDEDQDYDYKAYEEIILDPGYEMIPTTGSMIARIVDDIAVGQLNFTTEASVGRSTLNTTLSVGRIDGDAFINSQGILQYSFPIFTPPGVNGLVPKVNIDYVSKRGIGLVGYGWDISGLRTIIRGNKQLYFDDVNDVMKYNSSDAFYLDGDRLLPGTGANSYLSTKNENFERIYPQDEDSKGPTWFLIKTKDGLEIEIGHSTDSKLWHNDAVVVWKVNKITDVNGNYITYSYKNLGDEIAIETIEYTGTTENSPSNSINFKYSYNVDSRVERFVAGKKFTNSLYLTEVYVKHQSTLVRKLTLKYKFDHYAKLISVEENNTTFESRNSTLIKWENNLNEDNTLNTYKASSGFYSSSNVFFTGRILAKGDINGDGRFDYIMQGVPTSTYCIYAIVQDATGGTYSGPYYLKDGSNNTINFDSYTQDANILLFDIDKNGTDEFYHRVRVGGSSSHTYKYNGYNYSNGNLVPFSTENLVTSRNISDPGSQSSEFNFFSTVYPTDLNGNGNLEAAFYIKSGVNGDGLITMIATSTNSSEDLTNDCSVFTNISSTELSLYLLDTRVIDFNGDGKTDICVVKMYDPGYCSISVYSYDIANFTTTTIFSNTNNIFFKPIDELYFEDMNGDGNTDLFMRRPADKYDRYKTSEYVLYYSDGLKFIKKEGYANDVYLGGTYGTNPAWAHDFKLADINNDGLVDIYLNYLYDNKIFINTGFGFKNYSIPKFKLNSGFDSYISIKAYSYFTDINGDGFADFYGVLGQNDEPTIVLFNDIPLTNYPFINTIYGGNVVQSITDGFNQKMEFQYKYLMGNYKTRFYTNYANKVAANSYAVEYIPTYVATGVITKTNGGNTLRSKDITFAYAIIDQTEFGFMGFEIMTTTSKRGNSNAVVNITEDHFTFNTTYKIYYPTITYSYYKENSPSSVSNSYTYIFSALYGKRVWMKLGSTTYNDYFNSNTIGTSYTYDSYGNVTEQEIDDGFQTTNVTRTFTNVNSFCDNKIATETISKTIGTNTNSRVINYSYDTYGNLSGSVEFPSTSKSLTTAYTYNSAGLVTQKVVTASGLPTITDQFGYDNNLRFVTSHTNSKSQTEYWSYNDTYGNLLSEISLDGLTTSYTYDNWGNRITQTDYLEHTTDYVLGWCSTISDNTLYFTSSQPPYQPLAKQIYDIEGKVTQQIGANQSGTAVYIDYVYNDDGTLLKKCKPRFSGGTEKWIENTYESNTGKLSSVSDSDIGLDIDYTYDENKVRVVQTGTTTISDVTTEYNSNGSVKKITDLAGDIQYQYYGNGQVKQITGPSGAITSMVYDAYWRQTKLIDPDAGTIEYAYNAYGQLAYQKKADGTEFNMTYDNLGRITYKEDITHSTASAYTYKTTGYGLNQPSTITGWDGTYKTFSYDEFNRLNSTTETVSSQTFSHTYTYDTYGRLSTYTYPSGFGVTNTYNTYGFVSSIKENTNNQTIWTASTYDASGLPTEELLMNSIKIQRTFNKDLLTNNKIINSSSSAIFDYSYSYDYATENVLSRVNNIASLTESFIYDNMQRLIEAKLNGTTQLTTSFLYNGNINNKSDVSDDNYQYLGSQPHAVTKIENPKTPIPSFNQEITYNAHDRVLSISEEFSGSNVKLLEFTYSDNDERIKMVQKLNSNTVETRYYNGPYEKIVTSNATKEYNYINSPNGLLGVYIINGSTEELYYTYTDNIDNILGLMETDGTIAEEFNFDAWGRRRNPSNWTYSSIPTPTLISRGFTAHEHLDDFGLINMNARIYDPVLGRMIEPDNYVQAPNYSQSLNRYSYAWNNPLKYNDPTGNSTNKGRGTQDAHPNIRPYSPDFAPYADLSLFIGGDEILSAFLSKFGMSLSSDVNGGTGLGGGGGTEGAYSFGYVAGNSSSDFMQNYYAFRFDLNTYGGKYDKVNKSDQGSGDVNNHIIYQRITETDQSTTGTFSIPGTNIEGFILEPAGPSTTRSGLDRRIPAGTYNIIPNVGLKYGVRLYNDQVPQSRAILMHIGNYPDDTEGCLLPGRTTGPNFVGGSGRMINRIMNHFNQVGFNGATITIYDINRP